MNIANANISPITADAPWLACVVSAPRPVPTLPATLESLSRAGWTAPIVVYDGQRLGPGWNWLMALDVAVRQSRACGAEWILMAEDDIEITPNLKYRLSGLSIPESASNSVLSLYCSLPLPEVGWCNVFCGTARSAGALAYAMPLAVARVIRYGGHRIKLQTGADFIVPDACQACDIPIYVHSPSFVRHTGTTTSLRSPVGDERFRQCRKFVERIEDDGSFVVKDCGGVESVECGGKVCMAGDGYAGSSIGESGVFSGDSDDCFPF